MTRSHCHASPMRALGIRRRLPSALGLFLLAATCLQPILHAQGDAPKPVTFRNPTPIEHGNFGQAIAPVGTDFIVVGEWANTFGGAHLFRTNGTFVRKFPTRGSGFGSSVAGVGTNRVLIGAPREPRGTAYLLNTQGTLQATLNPPAGAAARYFGWSVAEVGDGLLLVGDLGATVAGKTAAGAAYLYRTNGTLVRTFTSPNPEDFANFGWAVAALGTDRVIIAARRAAGEAGAVSIFEVEGTHLVTIPNPQPTVAIKFGHSISAMGTNRVLIGASDDSGGNQGGAAYLFSDTGTLLTTFSNPAAPAPSNFGAAIAAIDQDRILIGAPEEKARLNAGAGKAYVYNTQGTLLTTLQKPNEKPYDFFGWGVAVVGPDRVMVTAIGDDTGALGAGSAVLLPIPVPATPLPELSITQDADTFAIRWTTTDTLTLEQSDLMGSPPVWVPITDSITTEGSVRILRRPVNTSPNSLFFRLRRP